MNRGVVAAAVALGAGSAQAETAAKLTVYGALNPAFLSFDDGQDSLGVIVDNKNATGRVGAWLDWSLAEDARLKFNFETATGTRASNTVSMTDVPDWFDWSPGDVRKAELTFAADWGKISAGQGSMASDGVAEFDASGSKVAGYSDYASVAGGFAFRRAGGALSDVTVKKVFTNLDGTRRWRVRYDTPEVSGFSGAVAYGTEILTPSDPDQYYDLALRYHGQAGAFRLAGGLGYSVTVAPDGSSSDAVMGSVSALHDATGMSVTLALGAEGQGGRYVYAKAGWIGDLVAVGQTAVALEYYRSDNIGVTAGSGQSWGVLATQKLPHRIEAYVGYRGYELAAVGATYLPAASFLMGAQWTF